MNNEQLKLLKLIEILESEGMLANRSTKFMDWLNKQVLKLFFKGA
jgi:hypothetical protein